MSATITVDTRGFEEMVAGINRGLSSFGQMVSTDKVLRTLIGRVLEGAIRRTPMAKVASIRKHFKSKGNHAAGAGTEMSVNDGSRGGVPGRVWYGEEPVVSSSITSRQRAALQRRAKRGGKVWLPINETLHQLGAGDRRRFEALNRQREVEKKTVGRRALEAALGARGLARNSWLQIAQKLGISLSKVAGGTQVARAHPSTGASYNPGNGIKVEGPGQLYYEIMNSYPFQRFKIAGAAILSRAIQGEQGYFRTNMRKGVFDDLGALAKKYKGVTVV